MKPPEDRVPRNVKALGLVSLLTDASSEMVYPVLPLFLSSVLGSPASAIGLIESVAEATASFMKVFSGWLSDRIGHRKWLVASGYTISNVAKPLLALAPGWISVMFLRWADRFGKGIRAAPRDALIADSSNARRRGRDFGVHRALDTVGAAIGPLTAWVILSLSPGAYRTVFVASAIPGTLAIVVVLGFVRDAGRGRGNGAKPVLRLRHLGKPFVMFTAASALFALGNSSDAMLILRAQNLGFHPAAGFLVGWLSFFVIYDGTIATLAAGFAEDLGPFVDLTPRGEIAVALALTLGVSALNYVGVRWGARANNLTAVVKIGALAVFALLGPLLGTGSASNLRPLVAGLDALSASAFGLALSPVLFSYLGWNSSVYVASEIRDPGRNVPRSLFLGVALCTAIYLLVNAVYLYAIPVGALQSIPNVGEAAARALFGAAGGTLLALFVLTSILGTLNANVLIGPRIAYAMALIYRSLSKWRRDVALVVAMIPIVILLWYTAPSTLNRIRMPQLSADIRPVMEYVGENRQPGDIVYVYHSAAPTFQYYASFYNLASGEIVIQPDVWSKKKDLENFFKGVKKLKGNDRVWIIISEIIDCGGCKGDPLDYFVDSLNAYGSLLDQVESPGQAGGYLYDLNP